MMHRHPPQPALLLLLTIITFLIITSCALITPRAASSDASSPYSANSGSLSTSSSCSLPTHAYVLMKFDLTAQRSHIKIDIVPETMNLLESIEGQIAIVSVAGMYRTGKSFLLNQLMPHGVPRNVFSVGHTIQSHTEEVSVYVIPPCALAATPLRDTTLLYLDTPGLFAPNRASLFDSQLMAILNLVSSVLIFNTKDALNRESIKQLSQAIDTASTMAYLSSVKSSSDSGSDAEKDLLDRPDLIWTLQNFALQMEDANGNPISSREYLQNMLILSDESSNYTTSYTDRFARFFKSIDTAGMPFPGEHFSDSVKLDQMSDDELAPAYIKARDALKSQLMKLIRPKRLGATMMNGNVLRTLMTQWVEEMKHMRQERGAGGGMLRSDQLLSHIETKEIERLIKLYEWNMDVANLPKPCSENDLTSAHVSVQTKLLAPYNQALHISLDSSSSTPMELRFLSEVKLRFQEEYIRRGKANQKLVNSAFENAQSKFLESAQAKVKSVTLPISQERLDALDASLKEEWMKETTSVSSLVSALTTDYNALVTKSLQTLLASLSVRNIVAHRESIIKELEQSLTELRAQQSGETMSEQEIRRREEDAKKKWQSLVASMRLPADSSVDASAPFTSSLNALILEALSSRSSLLESKMNSILADTKAEYAKHATTPMEIYQLKRIEEEARKKWHLVTTSMSVPSSALVHTTFLASLQALHQETTAKNAKLSMVQCLDASQKMLTQFLLDSELWYQTGYELYRNSFLVNAYLGELRRQPFCTGPAYQSHEVDAEFNLAQEVIFEKLNKRNQLAKVFVWSIYAVIVWQMITLMKLFQTSRKNGGGLLQWRSRQDRILNALSLPLSILLLLAVHFVPESSFLSFQLNCALIAFLLIYAAIGAKMYVADYRKYTETRSKCEV